MIAGSSEPLSNSRDGRSTDDSHSGNAGMHATLGAPPRPPLRERTRYAPNLPQEEFIVPLLRREIESCIARFATPVMGTARAVDIGCGGQPFRNLLEEIGYSYCGVDVNAEGGPPVDVVCAADEPLPEALLGRGPF